VEKRRGQSIRSSLKGAAGSLGNKVKMSVFGCIKLKIVVFKYKNLKANIHVSHWFNANCKKIGDFGSKKIRKNGGHVASENGKMEVVPPTPTPYPPTHTHTHTEYHDYDCTKK